MDISEQVRHKYRRRGESTRTFARRCANAGDIGQVEKIANQGKTQSERVQMLAFLFNKAVAQYPNPDRRLWNEIGNVIIAIADYITISMHGISVDLREDVIGAANLKAARNLNSAFAERMDGMDFAKVCVWGMHRAAWEEYHQGQLNAAQAKVMVRSEIMDCGKEGRNPFERLEEILDRPLTQEEREVVSLIAGGSLLTKHVPLSIAVDAKKAFTVQEVPISHLYDGSDHSRDSFVESRFELGQIRAIGLDEDPTAAAAIAAMEYDDFLDCLNPLLLKSVLDHVQDTAPDFAKDKKGNQRHRNVLHAARKEMNIVRAAKLGENRWDDLEA